MFKVSASHSSRQKMNLPSQRKLQKLIGLLREADAEGYLKIFQKEQISYDMLLDGTITEENLKNLNIPTGPRCKIMNVVVEHRFKNGNKKVGQGDRNTYLENVELTLLENGEYKKLGGGNFGDVYEGMWQGTQRVAMKKLNSGTALQSFMEEARILSQLRHPNIVSLYGIFVDSKNVRYIVTEFMPLGNLRHLLLRMEREELETGKEVEAKVLIRIARDAAAGMWYLNTQKILHRDLAARNLLVDQRIEDGQQKYVVKVADFGLSKDGEDIYTLTGESKFPVKWTPPETLKTGKFYPESDVYSFGITMYEIFSLGAEPWSGFTSKEVKAKVIEGQKMEIPPRTPPTIYERMMKCWESDFMKRPSFEELTKFLTEQLSKEEEEQRKLFQEVEPTQGAQVVTGDGYIDLDQDERSEDMYN